MNARNNINFCTKRTNIAQTATINSVIFRQNTTTNNLALQLLEGVTKLLFLLLIVHISKLFCDCSTHAFLNFSNAILAWELFSNRKSLVQISMSNLIDSCIKFVSVFWEQLEFLGFFSCNTLQLILSVANNLNKRLCSFQTTSYNFLIWLDLTLVIDQIPSVLASASFDHCNSNIVIFNNTTSNNNLKYCTLALTPTWESNPLTINQSQTHTRNWAFKRQSRNHSRCRCSIQSNNIVCIIWINCQNRFHNLHFVTQSVWEQWA
ncbi:Uncharacterised protein [Chlamydia trachomatis]|nr:Uncharacterised protein [Chlamydia trachomatis]